MVAFMLTFLQAIVLDLNSIYMITVIFIEFSRGG